LSRGLAVEHARDMRKPLGPKTWPVRASERRERRRWQDCAAELAGSRACVLLGARNWGLWLLCVCAELVPDKARLLRGGQTVLRHGPPWWARGEGRRRSVS